MTCVVSRYTYLFLTSLCIYNNQVKFSVHSFFFQQLSVPCYVIFYSYTLEVSPILDCVTRRGRPLPHLYTNVCTTLTLVCNRYHNRLQKQTNQAENLPNIHDRKKHCFGESHEVRILVVFVRMRTKSRAFCSDAM